MGVRASSGISADGHSVGPVRLWCDSRNDAEGHELTERFGVKMPKRITAARWLWTIRNQNERAAQAMRLTTPAGWIAYRLTGQWNLGIGDAAGMFPIDQETLGYDQSLRDSFDALTAGDFPANVSITPLPVCSPGQAPPASKVSNGVGIGVKVFVSC